MCYLTLRSQGTSLYYFMNLFNHGIAIGLVEEGLHLIFRPAMKEVNFRKVGVGSSKEVILLHDQSEILTRESW